MSAVPPYLRRTTEGYTFWCPGCKGAHHVRVGLNDHPCWTYNEDPNAPTFSPSVLISSRRWVEDKSVLEDGHWGDSYTMCHSFVTLGRIQFLGDCAHELAGQTVDMVPFPGSHE